MLSATEECHEPSGKCRGISHCDVLCIHDLTVAIQQTSCVRLCVSLYVCVCICHSVCVYMCVCVSRCLCLWLTCPTMAMTVSRCTHLKVCQNLLTAGRTCDSRRDHRWKSPTTTSNSTPTRRTQSGMYVSGWQCLISDGGRFGLVVTRWLRST